MEAEKSHGGADSKENKQGDTVKLYSNSTIALMNRASSGDNAPADRGAGRRTMISELKDGPNPDVFALVKASKPPEKTAGTDYLMKMYLTDESVPMDSEGFLVQMFYRDCSKFPVIEGSHQVIAKFPSLGVRKYSGGRLCGILDRHVGFFLFDAEPSAAYAPIKGPFSPEYVPGPADQFILKSMREYYGARQPGFTRLSSVRGSTRFSVHGQVVSVSREGRSAVSVEVADHSGPALHLKLWDRPREVLDKLRAGGYISVENICAAEITGKKIHAVVHGRDQAEISFYEDTHPMNNIVKMRRGSVRRAIEQRVLSSILDGDQHPRAVIEVPQRGRAASTASASKLGEFLSGPERAVLVDDADPVVREILGLRRNRYYRCAGCGAVSLDEVTLRRSCASKRSHAPEIGRLRREHSLFEGKNVFIEHLAAPGADRGAAYLLLRRGEVTNCHLVLGQAPPAQTN